MGIKLGEALKELRNVYKTKSRAVFGEIRNSQERDPVSVVT